MAKAMGVHMKEITIENQQPVETLESITTNPVHMSAIIASILALLVGAKYFKKLTLIAKWANVVGHSIRIAENEGLLKPSKLDDWLIEVSKAYLKNHPELNKSPKDIANILVSPEVMAELIDKEPKEAAAQLSKNAINDLNSEI